MYCLLPAGYHFIVDAAIQNTYLCEQAEKRKKERKGGFILKLKIAEKILDEYRPLQRSIFPLVMRYGEESHSENQQG